MNIYSDHISAGRTRTRETADASLKKFIATKKGNLRDYADACFRYLRYTGLISIAHRSRTITFFPDKLQEVDYNAHPNNKNVKERLVKKWQDFARHKQKILL